MNARERNQLLQTAENYFRSGNQALAKMALESLTAIDDSSSKAFELLGYVYGNEGRLTDAHRCLDKACRLPRPSPEAFYYLGVSLLKQGVAEPAIQAFDKSMALAGPFFEALHERGTACSRLGKHAAALESYIQALRLKPGSFDVVFNIGKVYDEVKDYRNALVYYERALALDSKADDVWAHRGALLYDLGQYTDAIDSWERALSIEPQIEHLRGFLLHAKLRLCDWRHWTSDTEALLARFATGEDVCGPFEMLAISGDESVQLESARRQVKANSASPPSTAEPRRSHQGKIRVGYFSADFGRHAVSYLIAELCELHDRVGFETFAFAMKSAAPGDETRARLVRAFDHFVDVAGQTDTEIVSRARDLNLDIAVDLGGHTRGSRTNVFRQRVAPVQVNYLGYPGTMGAEFIDYMIADETTIPVTSTKHYTEGIVWLPDCFQPSDTRRTPSESRMRRSELGLPDDGFVFCCFNNTYKINPDVFGSWMRILGKVEGACLWLLADSEHVEVNLRSEAARLGVDPGRLVFGGRLPLSEYLGRYRHADLFLDTLPFNGGTTANDALFAGLPILTRAGGAFAGRMAASLLNALDLPELVAGSWSAYEAMAIRLASDPVALRQTRSKLARNSAAGPLFDMPRYACHLEAAYREMFRRSQLGHAPDDIRVPPVAQQRS